MEGGEKTNQPTQLLVNLPKMKAHDSVILLTTNEKLNHRKLSFKVYVKVF